MGNGDKMYNYVCVIKNEYNSNTREEKGSIVSVYPPTVKLSTLTLEQLFFSGSKVEGYFVFTLLDDQGQLLYAHNHSSSSRGISVFVTSPHHLIGVGTLLNLVLSEEVEVARVAQEVGECLDPWVNSVGGGEGSEEGGGGGAGERGEEGGVGTLQYKAAKFDITVTSSERPYHDVTAVPLLKNVSPSNLIQIFSALLQERSVLLVSSNPVILSASVLSLLSLLYPMRWSSFLFPVLPTRLALLLHSTIPYVIGCVPYTLIAAGDPPPQTLVVQLDDTTLNAFEPIVSLPPPLSHALLEGLRKHGDVFVARASTRAVDMLLPSQLATPTALQAAQTQGFWAGVVESKWEMEKRWAWASSVLDNPIILENLEESSSTQVTLENGKQVAVDSVNLRMHFASVIASLIEPYPLLVSSQSSPSSPVDTTQFAAEQPESYFAFAKSLVHSNMMGTFLLEYLQPSILHKTRDFDKIYDFIAASRNHEICTRETRTIHGGYLWKRGHNMKTWRYRYFQLQNDDTIKYSEDKYRKNPPIPGEEVKTPSLNLRGTAILCPESEITIISIPDDKKREFATPFAFTITAQKPSKKLRTLCVCANTNDERRIWVKLLRAKAITTPVSATLPPPSPYPHPDDAARASTQDALRSIRNSVREKMVRAVEGAIRSRPFASTTTYNDIPCM